jgi:hypothetical protein
MLRIAPSSIVESFEDNGNPELDIRTEARFPAKYRRGRVLQWMKANFFRTQPINDRQMAVAELTKDTLTGEWVASLTID